MAEGATSDEEAALRELEARLERAAAAAERLLAASGRGEHATAEPGQPGEVAWDADAGAPPPRGWQRVDSDGGRRERWIAGEDADLLLSLLGLVRDRIPSELRERLARALHELLLAVRALLDWCLERAERRTATPTEVQDIPIL